MHCQEVTTSQGDRKPSLCEQLAEQWEGRARRRFMDADAEQDPMGRRLIEHGAICYSNAAQELRELVAKQWLQPT